MNPGGVDGGGLEWGWGGAGSGAPPTSSLTQHFPEIGDSSRRGWSKMPRDLEQVMLCVHSSTKHLFTVPGQCGTVEPIWFTPHLCDGCAS